MLSDRELKIAILGAVFGIVTTIIGSLATYWSKDKELNLEILKVALGVLREDPDKSNIRAAREWAVNIINSASPVPIPEAARAELIQHKFKDWFGGFDYGYDVYDYRTDKYKDKKPAGRPSNKQSDENSN